MKDFFFILVVPASNETEVKDAGYGGYEIAEEYEAENQPYGYVEENFKPDKKGFQSYTQFESSFKANTEPKYDPYEYKPADKKPKGYYEPEENQLKDYTAGYKGPRNQQVSYQRQYYTTGDQANKGYGIPQYYGKHYGQQQQVKDVQPHDQREAGYGQKEYQLPVYKQPQGYKPVANKRRPYTPPSQQAGSYKPLEKKRQVHASQNKAPLYKPDSYTWQNLRSQDFSGYNSDSYKPKNFETKVEYQDYKPVDYKPYEYQQRQEFKFQEKKHQGYDDVRQEDYKPDFKFQAKKHQGYDDVRQQDYKSDFSIPNYATEIKTPAPPSYQPNVFTTPAPPSIPTKRSTAVYSFHFDPPENVHVYEGPSYGLGPNLKELIYGTEKK